MGSLKATLERLRSSASFGDSNAGLSLILQVNLAIVKNNSQYLDFLRYCAYYREIVTASCLPSTSSRVETSYDLRERAMRLQSEETAVSAESASNAQGLSSFEFNILTALSDPRGQFLFIKPEITYKQALSLKQRSIFGLNTLLENLSSWVEVTDDLPDDALPGEVALEQLCEPSYAWSKAGDSVREALVLMTLTRGPAQRLSYLSAPLASKYRQSAIRRWLTSLVCLS